MTPKKLDEIVAICRKREQEFEAPTVAQPAGNDLEAAVCELATRLDVYRNRTKK